MPGTLPETTAQPGKDEAVLSQEILRIVNDLATELHPHRTTAAPEDFDADLDQTYGLDSLGRMELIGRLETVYNVKLPERLFAEADTPRNLLNAICAAGARPSRPMVHRVEERHVEGARSAPKDISSLGGVLAWHAQHNADRPQRLSFQWGT